LEVWELDEAFLPALRQNLSACAALLRQAGIRTTVQLNHGSYDRGTDLLSEFRRDIFSGPG
jgi:hypothetical protein